MAVDGVVECCGVMRWRGSEEEAEVDWANWRGCDAEPEVEKCGGETEVERVWLRGVV